MPTTNRYVLHLILKPRGSSDRKLAAAFHRVKLIEQWGTGTLRIIAAYTDQGLPPPEFRFEMSTFIVRLFPTPPSFDVPAKSRVPDLNELNERQRKAIEYIQQHGGITVAHLVTIVGVTTRQARRDMQGLATRGVVARIGQSKSTRYGVGGVALVSGNVQ